LSPSDNHQPDNSRSGNPCPGSSRAVGIGIVSGEPIRLEGLISVFEENPEPGHAQLVPIIGSMNELVANPDVNFLIVDLNSAPGGLAIFATVRRLRPKLRLIVIGPDHDDEMIQDAIIAGARAFLDSSASPQSVRMAIEQVVQGSIWAPRRLLSALIDRLLAQPESPYAQPKVTAREREVLELILLARSNREIARQLGIEERTVKAHVGRLMRKTGADNRIELSMRAMDAELVPRPASQDPTARAQSS